MGIGRVLRAFLVRDVRTARSYRLAWVLDAWGTIFQLVMFYFLSRIVHIPTLQSTTGQPFDYFPFVVIGLSLLGFLSTGVSLFAASLRSEQTNGTLEVLLSMPTSPTLIMFGVAMYGFARSLLMTCAMLTLAAVFFGLRIVIDPVPLAVALATLLASSGLFASLGILVAAATMVFKQAAGLMGLISQVIGLLSGVFYPIELLPKPLQLLGELIPVTWALDVLRKALLTGEIAWVRVGFLFIASAVAVPASLWIFDKAVQRARREGSLGQF